MWKISNKEKKALIREWSRTTGNKIDKINTQIKKEMDNFKELQVGAVYG